MENMFHKDYGGKTQQPNFEVETPLVRSIVSFGCPEKKSVIAILFKRAVC